MTTRNKAQRATKWALCAISAIMALVLSCSKDEERSAAKKVEALVFRKADNESLDADITATIDQDKKQIKATVPFATVVTALTPNLTISEGASFDPQGPQDFSGPVTYTITAENGSTAGYTVTVNTENPSSAQLERAALIALSNANPDNSLGWPVDDPDSDIASWQGVTVQDGRVVKLSLDRKNLTVLPPDIGDLSNLSELDLYHNQLESLPERIGDLTNLTYLGLGGNQLENLPERIGDLSNLTTLYLENNHLTKIPERIGDLSNLTDLDLGSNKLTEIPQRIGDLTNLNELYLKNNLFTSVPQKVCDLGAAIKANGGEYDIDDNVECVADPGN